MIDEYCPGKEVKLKQGFVKQNCPECGSWLLPCSMCNTDEIDCRDCLAEK